MICSGTDNGANGSVKAGDNGGGPLLGALLPHDTLQIATLGMNVTKSVAIVTW